MANQKRSFVLFSEREALANIIEEWAKECDVECSVFNVLSFLNSVKLLNADSVVAFIYKNQ